MAKCCQQTAICLFLIIVLQRCQSGYIVTSNVAWHHSTIPEQKMSRNPLPAGNCASNSAWTSLVLDGSDVLQCSQYLLKNNALWFRHMAIQAFRMCAKMASNQGTWGQVMQAPQLDCARNKQYSQ
jgi:hypothetical protein